MTLRILFFCLVPIGILLLVFGLKFILKAFKGSLILEIPFEQKSGLFTIIKAGTYSIWQKGEILKQTPIDKFRPHIYRESTNEELKTYHSILRPNMNDTSTGRMEIFTFYAEVGKYRLELKEGSSLLFFKGFSSKINLLRPVDLSKYHIQIRTSQSQFITALSIPMMLLGVLGIAAGLVYILMPDQLFN